MKLRSPIAAMLWELWRVTRIEAAWKLALPVVLGLIAMGLCAAIAPDEDPRKHEYITEIGARIALIMLVVPNILGWLSPAINVGKPGFPLPLLYTRPVRTVLIVGLPTLYLTVLTVVIYLASALLLRVVSGHPFPLLPVAVWLAALNLLLRAVAWSSRSMVGLMLGAVVAFTGWSRLARLGFDLEWSDSPQLWPEKFHLSLTGLLLIVLIGLVSFGVTVARVAQQRRGDVQPDIPSASGNRLWSWLIDRFHLPCPTTSATRALVWFNLKSKGLPLLAVGAAFALVIPLFFAVSGPFDTMLFDEFHVTCAKVSGHKCFIARGLSMFFAMQAPLVILALGANAFGIVWKKARLSSFDAIRPCDTARLARLRILTVSACALAAIILIQVSTWTSIAIFGAETFKQVTNVQLDRLQAAIAALDRQQLLAMAFMAIMWIGIWVTALAALAAVLFRYPRGVLVVVWSLLFCFILFVLLALAVHNGIVPLSVAEAGGRAVGWILLASMALAVAYLLRSGFAERVLTMGYANGAIVLSAVLAAAWVTVLHMAGVQLAAMSVVIAVLALSPAWLSLIFILLAPWSLNRIRHM